MQQQPTLALKQIQVSVNPRKYFDAAEMEELTASVREKGVIQPVIVRTLADGGFGLVAGGRRYKAALAAHGEDYEIPVVVRDIDEVEARRAGRCDHRHPRSRQDDASLEGDQDVGKGQ